MAWALSLVGLGGLVGLGNWRNAVLFLMVVGFLQDPIRKVLPGLPVYMQILALFFLGVIFVCAMLQNTRMELSYVDGRDSKLRQAWGLFLFLIAGQCVHTYLLYGNLVLAGLGLINYAAPVMAIILGVAFAEDDRWIRRLLWAYLLLAIPFALTVYLSLYFQDDWDILKSIGRLAGSPLLIFDQGTVLYSNSGLMRAGEIAAWHAGTAVMLLIMFATMDQRKSFRVFAGIIVMLLIGAIVLTGRRKMIMAIAIFFAVFLFLLMVYWRGTNKIGALIAVLSVGAAVYIWLQPDEGESTLYAARSVTVFQDATDRLGEAWDLLRSGYQRGGIFGLGAGISAQGSQYFGGGTAIAGGAAEAGGGKVVVELGVIGLLVIAYLLWRLFRHFDEFFRLVPADYEYLSVMLAGITAIIIANASTFLVATQVFGDTFILILMGFFVSFLFALERLTRVE